MAKHVDYENGTTRIRSDWLVVIEWLGEDDQKTGTELVRHLKSKRRDLSVELVVCHSRAEFLTAIAAVKASVPARGIPILHIEAHGNSVFGDGTGFRGPEPNGGKAVVLWKDLEAPLSALNVASGFALTVVTAACLSDTVLFTISQDRAAPFLLLVTFSTEVSWSTLEAAMKALYSGWLVEGRGFEEAFLAAKDQLNPHEKIGVSLVSKIVFDVAVRVAETRASKDNFERLYLLRSINRGRAIGHRETRLEVLRESDASMVRHLDKMVSVMLGYDLFPDNRRRFKIDAQWIARKVLRRRRWSV